MRGCQQTNKQTTKDNPRSGVAKKNATPSELYKHDDNKMTTAHGTIKRQCGRLTTALAKPKHREYAKLACMCTDTIPTEHQYYQTMHYLNASSKGQQNSRLHRMLDTVPCMVKHKQGETRTQTK